MKRRASRAVALAALIGPPMVMIGCGASPTAPPPPPGGGQTLTLSYDQFVADVEPVLTQHGCDTVAGGDCHGGGIQGTFELSPSTAKNPQFDFDQSALQVSVSARDSSHLLTKPLALSAGGVPHSVKVFADTSDAGYRAIRAWILAGVAR